MLRLLRTLTPSPKRTTLKLGGTGGTLSLSFCFEYFVHVRYVIGLHLLPLQLHSALETLLTQGFPLMHVAEASNNINDTSGYLTVRLGGALLVFLLHSGLES